MPLFLFYFPTGLFFIGGAAILYLNSLQNQQNSVSPFIDKPEPLDSRPLTFPNPTPTRPEIETYPKPNDRSFDPNAINRSKDFGDIGKICRNLGFPANRPLFSPNDINKGRNFDLLLPHIFLSGDETGSYTNQHESGRT